MKVLLALLPLLQGAFSYWGYPSFDPSQEYLGWCSPTKVKDPNNVFIDFFPIKDLNNNAGEGNIKLDTIFCYQGAGAPSILLTTTNKQPEKGDSVVLFELGTKNKKSFIRSEYGDSPCVRLTTPQLFFDNSATCVNLQLEQNVYKDDGRASYSILTGPPGTGDCFDINSDFINEVQYISFTTDSKGTNTEESFYINCFSPYYSPPNSGPPTNILVNVEQSQVAAQG